jgi:hypothetical protein
MGVSRGSAQRLVGARDERRTKKQQQQQQQSEEKKLYHQGNEQSIGVVRVIC